MAAIDGWKEGDQMILWKKSPNTFFENWYITLTGKHTALKLGLLLSLIKTRAQSKQSPDGRKIAQSGHPGWKPEKTVYVKLYFQE
jgi:hypothetical protein